MLLCCVGSCVFFFKQNTAYEMRISDWSSDVCSSDLTAAERDDLEAAGDALAQATDRPVTLDLVNYVNAQLDVRTALTARQIAAAANDLPLAAGGLRRGVPGGATDAAAEDIIGDAVQR